MATTMQPEIPWNVAGIAPEAREAARTSARREGLSVGEWLTRRILRGLPEPGEVVDEWWFAENRPNRTPSNENPIRTSHLRNEDALRRLLQRANESQSQRRDASGEVAAQPKSLARNDSDIAKQLSERIVHLDARIARVEIKAAAEEAKHAETIKALSAKVAELTERISGTAARSAAQDSQLARAVEAVTEKFLQSQSDAGERQSAINVRLETITEDSRVMSARIETVAEDNRVMSERIEAIAGDNDAIHARVATLADDATSMGEKLAEAREEGERQLRAVEDRVAATEGAIETVRHDSGELDRLGGSLDQLAQRFEATDVEYLNNVERVESRLARIEANSGEAIIDRRLQGIEQALADMAKLIEKSAPEKPIASVQSEPADPKPDVAQLRDGPPPAQPFGASTATPILDLPPFPEKPKNFFALPPDSAVASPAADLRARAPGTPIFGDSAKPPSPPEESRLSAAGRNANAESSAEPRNGPFSWIDSNGAKLGAGAPTYTRLILLGGLGLLVLTAIGMGLYLSSTHGPGAAHTAQKPIQYGVIGTAQRPISAQPQPRAAQMASSARKIRVAASPNPAPVQTAADLHSHTTAVQKRPVPPAAPIRTSRVAAKPLAQLQRLTALANSGHAKAQEVLGLAYLDGDGVAVNEAEGAKWLQRAAARGEAVAAYRLGTLYERGHGVAADRVKAAQWYEIAAKAGNRKAMHNLAVAYAQGSGVRKNVALAVQWFSRAANLGLADSQFDLAVLYERGLGVPQSLRQAYKWYAIAAAQGDTESKARMEAIASQLSAGDRAAAEKSATRFQQAPLDGAANAPPIAASLLGAS